MLFLASYLPLVSNQQHYCYPPLISHSTTKMSSDLSTASGSVPSPASPFSARPDPTQSVVLPDKDNTTIDSPSSTTSDSTLVNPSSTAQPKAELVGGHKRISYPLTSFDTTPHNISAFGFALGIVFTLGLVLASSALKSKTYLWGNEAVSSLGPQGLFAAMTNPSVGIYLAFWATFHMLEFQVTSIYNPGKLSIDCEHS